MKPNLNQFLVEDKTLKKAYKNVIRVITNILGNIEEEKNNGKINYLNASPHSQKRKITFMPIQQSKIFNNKSLLENSPKSMLIKKDYKKSKSKKSQFFTNISKNSYNLNKSSCSSNKNVDTSLPIIQILKPDKNEKNKNKIFINNIKDELQNSTISTRLNKSKFHSSNKKLKIDNSPSKLYSQRDKNFNHNYNTNITVNKKYLKKISGIKKESQKSLSILNDESNLSLSSSSFTPFTSIKKVVRKSITKNEKSLHSIKSKSSKKNVNSKSMNITKNKNTVISKGKNKNSIISKIITSNKNINQKLYEYENNEITDLINKLPEDKHFIEQKTNLKRRKSLIFTKELKDIIDLKPDVSTLVEYLQKCNKEKYFRCLLFKGNVYDSLNDDEESEEEIEDNFCYFEPDSTFLYVFDSIIFLSSLIILIYLPYYLAKNIFFCQNIFDINTLIFYFIDFLYILDLIINFYRSYYNFDEYLVKQNLLISINYFKTWFLFDLITSIPTFTILKSLESKCIEENIYKDVNLNNNGIHSHYYNTNPNKLHYLLILIKSIKTLKIFKKNITIRKIGHILYGSDFLTDWGNVLLYSFFLLSFLNLGSCLYIFIGRNNSLYGWILNDNFNLQNFYEIYVGAVYYVIATVTTVGYGDLIGKNLIEIIFRVIMLIAGTCIYSWLISSISNYIKKMSERNTKYEKKLEILQEIKLNNPHLNNKLYEKILRLLHYRKYHEDETEKNIVLNSLPNSLKNTLIIEMYKKFINDFMFFRGIDNKEFIVQIISKLKPVIGVKGDTLIKEGESIDDIIFIKDGILSLEICIDRDFPEKSIEDYLINNGYLNSQEIEGRKSKDNMNLKKLYNRVKSYGAAYYYGLIKQRTKKYNKNISINNYLQDNNLNESSFETEKNLKRIKILDIRKNEHFGDVLMFLNKKSPLYVRVRSNKADLLLLKKLDALKISTNYPNIWKKIIKKPLANSKIIQNLTLKMLVVFCNYYGIKSRLFKKRKRNKNYPSYYLRPILNSEDKISNSKSPKKNNQFMFKDNSNLIKENNIEKKNESKIKKNQKYKSDLITTKNKLINTFRERYGELIANNIKFCKSFENNYIKLFDLNSNHKKSINNISKEYFLSEANDNSIKKAINNNHYANSFSFQNSKLSYKKYNSNYLISNISNYDKSADNSSKSLNRIYKPTLFKRNSQNSSINKRTNFQTDKNFNKKIKDSSNILNNNEKNKLDFENINFKSDEINDELYPGEDFIIKSYDNENLKNLKEDKNINTNTKSNILKRLQSTKIYSDKVYINNYNIYKSPYIQTCYNNNNFNVKNEYFESKKPKIFENLEISSSISTLDINSSYENINKITNNRYISNEELKSKTKKFLLEECLKLDNIVNFIKNIGEYNEQNLMDIRKQISKKQSAVDFSNKNSGIFDNNSFLKNYSHNIRNASSFNNYNLFNKRKRYYDNRDSNIFIKEETFSKFQDQLNDKKISSSITLQMKNNLHSFDTFNNFSTFKNKDRNPDIISEEKPEDYTSNGIKNPLDANHDNIKKKKKRNEMDIISLNIKQSSRNLNQPDLFYADLFSHLISNKRYRNRYNSSSKIRKTSIILEKNEAQEMDEDKIYNYYDDNSRL